MLVEDYLNCARSSFYSSLPSCSAAFVAAASRSGPVFQTVGVVSNPTGISMTCVVYCMARCRAGKHMGRGDAMLRAFHRGYWGHSAAGPGHPTLSRCQLGSWGRSIYSAKSARIPTKPPEQRGFLERTPTSRASLPMRCLIRFDTWLSLHDLARQQSGLSADSVTV